MKDITGKALVDKIGFVFYSMTYGVFFWILSSVLISWQQYVIKQYRNGFISLLFYLVPYLVLLWFMTVSGKKNQWKPFGKSSNLLTVLIVVAEFLILLYVFGNVSIRF